jgi:hypothetical protein
MNKYQLSRYYQLRRKILGYYLGKTEIRPTDEENSEYVKLFNLYVWNIKDSNESERSSYGYAY